MRMTTESLIEAILLDIWPTPGACCDFGLDRSDKVAKFGALQHGFRAEEFTSAELDAALGDGPALTELVKRFGCPLVFKTALDDIGEYNDEWDEDYDDEPDVDEAQEWHDFDPDC